MEMLIAAMLVLRLDYLGDAPVCFEEQWIMGQYDAGELVLCESNIAASDLDKEQTLRHEVIHAAQHCASGLLYEGRDYLGQLPDFPYLAYDARQWDTEAEARVLAREMTSQQVADMAVDRCLPIPPW